MTSSALQPAVFKSYVHPNMWHVDLLPPSACCLLLFVFVFPQVLVQQFHGESEKLHNTEMKRSRTHREINQNRAPSSRNLNNNATVQM